MDKHLILQFNKMHETLRRIAQEYQEPNQMQASADHMGLSLQEYIEMAYDNIQGEARTGINGVSTIPVPPDPERPHGLTGNPTGIPH